VDRRPTAINAPSVIESNGLCRKMARKVLKPVVHMMAPPVE
jgi:hypothetical protein